MLHRPIRPLDLIELQTLVVCADSGSFAAAGEHLGVSRVAVTKRIGNLEAVVGQPLLERGSRGVRLTETGARLCAHAQVALQHSEEMTEFVAELRGERRPGNSAVRSLLTDSKPADRVAASPEAQLAEIHQLFEHVFDTSATGLALSDLERGMIIEVNVAMCRLLGRTRDELVGKSSVSLGLWHSSDDRERLMAQLGDRGSFKSVPMRARRSDGAVVDVEASGQMLKLGGRDLTFWSLVDVSQAHAAEDAQREAERWRKIAGFGMTVVPASEIAVVAQGATDLLVEGFGHTSAAVVGPIAGKIGVIAQSGEGVDWSARLDDLPGLGGVSRALRRNELDVLTGAWGYFAPIGEAAMLITLAADQDQGDPTQVQTIAQIVGVALQPLISRLAFT